MQERYRFEQLNRIGDGVSLSPCNAPVRSFERARAQKGMANFICMCSCMAHCFRCVLPDLSCTTQHTHIRSRKGKILANFFMVMLGEQKKRTLGSVSASERRRCLRLSIRAARISARITLRLSVKRGHENMQYE